jgi:outer membrane protein assembly factor BamD
MKKQITFLLMIAMSFGACSDYQKLFKSTDIELKYSKAIEYFDKGDFVKATALFDDVSPYFKGTPRSEKLLNYICKSYMGQKDYFSASEYYSTYVKTFPKGQFILESKYMIGYCYYLESPDARLDQTYTFKAITALQDFLDNYPENERTIEAVKLIDELNDKLAYKAFLNSKLYYNLGNYLGNNYEAAVISAQNALRDFPSSIYREDLLMIILESKYQQAVQSIEERKMDRYRNTQDEYYNYINEFPEGKSRKRADEILNQTKKITKD